MSKDSYIVFSSNTSESDEVGSELSDSESDICLLFPYEEMVIVLFSSLFICLHS